MQGLNFHFDRCAVMEVYNEDRDTWYRTTEMDFRSFNGRRRLTINDEVEKGCTQTQTTIPYNGPVFAYGTNNEVKYNNSGVISKSEIWDNDRKSHSDFNGVLSNRT